MPPASLLYAPHARQVPTSCANRKPLPLGRRTPTIDALSSPETRDKVEIAPENREPLEREHLEGPSMSVARRQVGSHLAKAFRVFLGLPLNAGSVPVYWRGSRES